MTTDLEIIQVEIDADTLSSADARLHNQLAGIMHAHNELTILNRILMFSMNATGEGELHDSAQSVQMWCILQLLVGKLFETWNLLIERFLKAQPTDPALNSLSDEHKESLDWLTAYFGIDGRKQSTIRTIRDKTAFHFDKLNLSEAAVSLANGENSIYLARHPANSLYYIGSALVFRSAFAMIADNARDTSQMSHGERVAAGTKTALEEVQQANRHMHLVLYGLINGLLERVAGTALSNLEQTRIKVAGAPDPEAVGIPTFIDIGGQPSAP